MALKDLFSFFDNTLEETFSRKEVSKEQLRAPLLRGIEQAKSQYENNQTKAPNRWWKVSNEVVALTVKVKGDTMDINGVATNHMPAERFVEFLGKFKLAVEAGDFDAELKNKGNGDAKVHIPPAAKASKPATSTTPSITGVRRSVGKSLSVGRPLDEIEAALKAAGKYSVSDIDTVIAEKRAA